MAKNLKLYELRDLLVNSVNEENADLEVGTLNFSGDGIDPIKSLKYYTDSYGKKSVLLSHD